MIELIFWAVIFIISLLVLLKGADWLVIGAERIGLAIGLSPFIVGVVIVGIGTSFPELFSSLAAVFKGVPEVVAANVIGSNIANILLIVGISAIFGRGLVVTKNLIDLDLPLLAIGTVLFLGVVWDKQITIGESILMLLTYFVYFLYTILYKEKEEEISENSEVLLKGEINITKEVNAHKLRFKDFFMVIFGILGIFLGAKYLIEALVNLSLILNVATGLITITAVAVGTSFPELLVSVKAAYDKKHEISLGNIFGSNIFNAFVVTGLPGIFSRLPVDEKTFYVGVPTMAIVTLLFVISGISRKIHIWEGAFYVSAYVLFIAKLFSLF